MSEKSAWLRLIILPFCMIVLVSRVVFWQLCISSSPFRTLPSVSHIVRQEVYIFFALSYFTFSISYCSTRSVYLLRPFVLYLQYLILFDKKCISSSPFRTLPSVSHIVRQEVYIFFALSYFTFSISYCSTRSVYLLRPFVLYLQYLILFDKKCISSSPFRTLPSVSHIVRQEVYIFFALSYFTFSISYCSTRSVYLLRPFVLYLQYLILFDKKCISSSPFRTLPSVSHIVRQEVYIFFALSYFTFSISYCSTRSVYSSPFRTLPSVVP